MGKIRSHLSVFFYRRRSTGVRLLTRDRIVITGMGAVTPIGIGVSSYWRNLCAGVSGVSMIERFDARKLPVKIAAEVKDFDPLDFMSKKLARTMDIFMQFAFAAAGEALKEAKLKTKPERIGIVLGTALAGISTAAETQKKITGQNSYRVSPHTVPKILGNIAAAQIAIHHEIKGPSLTVNSACSSGADAIGTAQMLLKSNQADAVIAVGAESILTEMMTAGLASARALTTELEQPERASRPFDFNRNGFVMGEGAGAVVLERLDEAISRDADIHAELLGYAANTDAYHVTAPEPDGSGQIRCMQEAIRQAGLHPEQIDYINAHGTSTKLGDRIETASIKKVFGESAINIPVSSTKGATGHLMGAGGVTEFIACIKAIQESTIPPTINYETEDPDCDLDYVPNKARKADIKIAMSNAFGFGGQNTSLIVGKYEKLMVTGGDRKDDIHI